MEKVARVNMRIDRDGIITECAVVIDGSGKWIWTLFSAEETEGPVACFYWHAVERGGPLCYS